MKFKLCAFADEAGSSINEQIDALKRNNIYAVELRSIDGKNVFDFTVEDAKEYARIFKENNIEVWSMGSPIGKVDININFDKYLSKVISFFKICHVFECKRIRMFSFFNASNCDEQVIKYLKAMVDAANKEGIELYHENEKDIYGDYFSRVEILKREVQGLKFIYDPANYIQVGEDINVPLNKAIPFTSYFHIKDCFVSTKEVVPAGMGDAQIEEMLNTIDFDTTLTTEPHLKIFSGYQSVDQHELKNKFEYPSNNVAFDEAVKHLKEILIKLGYKEVRGGFEK